MPLLHVSQLASALGLRSSRSEVGSTALAWDIASILDSWCDHLRTLSFGEMVEPTPSRGRSLRNLTVNTFHPIELLPVAWTDGRFDWDPDGDEEREQALRDARAVVDHAARVAGSWSAFLLEHGDEMGAADPVVSSPRGDVTYSALLASQRWHAAYHYRQLLDVLAGRDKALAGTLRLEALADLDLPAEVF